MNNNISNLLQKIKNQKTNMYNGDFLLTWERTDSEINATMYIAKILKEMHKDNISTKVFNSGLAISNFRDNSTRTRFSFASAANLLGLEVQDLDESASQIAHGETVRETANMISFLSEVIGIRDDMYLGAGHTYQKEVSDSVNEGFKEGVLPQRPSVINLQCDIDHPTQSMADLCHLETYFGGIENLKGKKIAMTWAYSPSYGKPLSVPQGIIGLMTRMGMDVSLAYPEGYGLIPEVIELSKKQAAKNGSKFEIVNSMEEAFKDADIVYPKSWAPFSVMGKRTELLYAKDFDGLKTLEKQCLTNNAKHKDWECDEKKMKLTKNGEALYMHCLPADISGISCKEGEVSSDVFEKYRIETYKEAGYKPFIIAAMMLLTRFKNVPQLLDKLLKENNVRVK
ncbi:MAG: knotted carbamoyltransferase YgeW [Candidatus Muirbacterium halophilum]|nr:knotted carbamoyltransferase YgeW [Candidatus Muirbacterium halophilum]MCK9474526.1 knotted carbamoyltransferase YgeW [Candidatus Muirbacterium halophilum]